MTVYIPGLNETDLKKIILSLQQLGAGRSNATGTVTLAANSATTVVTPAQAGMIATGSQPILTSITRDAARQRKYVRVERQRRLLHHHSQQ